MGKIRGLDHVVLTTGTPSIGPILFMSLLLSSHRLAHSEFGSQEADFSWQDREERLLLLVFRS
jgi:hypothetical protein